MEFSELIYQRYSSRDFTSKDVADEQIDSILAAIESAPSSGNDQAYKIAVVRDPDLRERIALASRNQKWMTKAPVLLVFFGDVDRYRERIGERLQYGPVQDPTIAMVYAQLAAVDVGLGSCWVAPHAGEEAAKILGLDGNLRLAGILPIGWPADSRPKRRRRKPEEWTVRL
jgi:nitroreductase